MANDEFARLLHRVGQTVLALNPAPEAPILLYAELDTNMVSKVLLVDRGADVLAIFPNDDDFTYLLLDLWGEQPAGKRWSEIEYLIRDGRFTTTFTYPEELDPEDDKLDRRERIIEKHFGRKPLVYAPDERFDRMERRAAEQEKKSGSDA
jgi:hypothetical protein